MTISITALTLLSVPPAVSAASEVQHSKHVVTFFKTHRWLRAPEQPNCKAIPWTKSCRIARRVFTKHFTKVKTWERQQEIANRVPVGEAQIRAWLVQRVGRTSANCLGAIIDMENGRWDPTIDFGGGHGNVYEAYGLPQAYPGHKMSSAGADYRTNPKTQLEWMIRYTTERYGSPCGGWASRRDTGMY